MIDTTPEPTPALAEAGRLLAHALSTGRPVEDADLDALLSAQARARSSTYWSCLESIREACQLFDLAGAQQVLDVGAGPGKFCAVAAVLRGRPIWGVERRPPLAAEARGLARVLGAPVTVLEGPLHLVEPGGFDGFYFYNPFTECVMDPAFRYEDDVGTVDSFVEDVARVERWLRAAPLGTAVVTFNGMGGVIPSSFRIKRSLLVHRDVMRLWVKERGDVPGEGFVEFAGDLFPVQRFLDPDDPVAALAPHVVRLVKSPLRAAPTS